MGARENQRRYANTPKGKAFRRKQKIERRQRALDYTTGFKARVGCQSCGERDPVVLQFHHRDPSQKDKAIALLITNDASMARIRREMEKCDVLCANCHLRVHG